MDMAEGYGDGENPVVLKSEFLLSLCEQLVGSYKLNAREKSIIDRCTANVYRYYLQGNYQGQAPTLQDFHAELLKQPETEARDVALAMELFTDGSLNTFAKPTNVNTNARILCYDIRLILNSSFLLCVFFLKVFHVSRSYPCSFSAKNALRLIPSASQIRSMVSILS